MHTITAPAVPDVKQGRSRALCAAAGALAAALAWIVEVPVLGIHLTSRFAAGHIQTIAIGQVIGVTVAASRLGWLLLALLERRTPHARPLWTTIALATLAASLALPLAVATTTSAAAGLIVMRPSHTVACVAVGAGRRRRPCPGGGNRGDANQAVVGDQGDGQVHGHEYRDRPGRLPPDEEVQVRKPQHQCDQYRHPRKQPAGRGTDPGDDRPCQAGDHDTDDRQLGVIGKAEVDISPGRRKDRGADQHEQRVDGQRAGDGDDRGGRDPAGRRLPVSGREVHADKAKDAAE